MLNWFYDRDRQYSSYVACGFSVYTYVPLLAYLQESFGLYKNGGIYLD